MQENMETQFSHIDTNNLEPSQVIPTLSDNDEIFDMSDDFDFGDFQVVRREFFAHLREPSLTFNNCRIYVNMAAVSKFPHADYIPSWSNSIERTKTKADLSIVSDKARANLISALYNLQNCVDGMLKAIKEDK